jgi:hypothetical protein
MTFYRQRSLLALVLAVFAAALIVVWRSKPSFWSRMWSARVEMNGSSLTNARVYRGPQGYVMVYLGRSAEYGYNNIYVVRIPRGEVGVTGNYYFRFISPFGALAKDTVDPSINMMHEKFNYADPHLGLAKQSATFQTLGGQAIHVKW